MKEEAKERCSMAPSRCGASCVRLGSFAQGGPPELLEMPAAFAEGLPLVGYGESRSRALPERRASRGATEGLARTSRDERAPGGEGVGRTLETTTGQPDLAQSARGSRSATDVVVGTRTED